MRFQNQISQWRSPVGTTASVVVAGDICPRKAEKEILDGKSPEIFRGVLPFLDSADLRVVQWECVLGEFDTPIDKRGPNLQVPAGCVQLMTAIHTDVALLANNHVGDFGPAAALATKEVIEAKGIRTVGAGKDLDDAAKPLSLTVKGIPLVILNFAEHEFGTADEGKAGTAGLDLWTNLEAIRKAKATGAVVLVALHGGHEQNPFPSPRMVDLFRAYTEAGADMLWNCHTHCPEGVEVVNGKPIVYSPGNFYFPPVLDEFMKNWHTGYLTKFYFDAQGAYAMELLPYTQVPDAVKPLDAAGEQLFFDYMETLCAPLADRKSLNRKFDLWCGIGGFTYLACLEQYRPMPPWPQKWSDGDVVRRYLFFRNLFTCESHNDLLRRTLRLIEEYKYEDILKQTDEIKKLWDIPWM